MGSHGCVAVSHDDCGGQRCCLPMLRDGVGTVGTAHRYPPRYRVGEAVASPIGRRDGAPAESRFAWGFTVLLSESVAALAGAALGVRSAHRNPPFIPPYFVSHIYKSVLIRKAGHWCPVILVTRFDQPTINQNTPRLYPDWMASSHPWSTNRQPTYFPGPPMNIYAQSHGENMAMGEPTPPSRGLWNPFAIKGANHHRGPAPRARG